MLASFIHAVASFRVCICVCLWRVLCIANYIIKNRVNHNMFEMPHKV